MKKLRIIQPSDASAAAAEGSTVVRNKMPFAVQVSDDGHYMAAKETGAISEVDETLRKAIAAGHVVVLAESAKKMPKAAKKSDETKTEVVEVVVTQQAEKSEAKEEATTQDVDSAEASF